MTPSRRIFLRGLGLGAGAALVPLLEGDRALAATASGFPRRLIVVVTPNGVLQRLYWPTGGERDFAFPTGNDEIPGITAPLNEIRDDVLCVKGLNMQSAIDDKHVFGGHDNFTHLLVGQRQLVKGSGKGHDFRGTKAAGAISVDQFIAERLNAPTRWKSLVAGVMAQHGSANQARISWSGAGVPVTPQENPAALFSTLFTAGPQARNEPIEQIFRDRRSVLDVVTRDLARFQQRLGAEDRAKVDTHLTSLRELERRFDPRHAARSACAAPEIDPLVDPNNMPHYPRVGQLQMDLLVEAMACDLTRVASLQWSNSGASNVVFSWLGDVFTEGATKDGAGRPEFNTLHNHHEITHHGEKLAPLKSKVEHWYHQQFVHLVKKLKSKREGDGTMLDNTAVLWANNMHDGAAHSHGPHLPWILAGRCGGYFKSGRYVDLSSAPVPHNRLLLSLCEAMGVGVPAFGDPAYCVGGALSQLRG